MTLPPLIRREKKRADTRLHSAEHRASVRRHPCLVPECSERPIQSAHVRTGTDGALSIKPSSFWCVPLCAAHHQQQHNLGERSFEERHGIDLRKSALEFALHSPDPAIKRAAKAARVKEIES